MSKDVKVRNKFHRKRVAKKHVGKSMTKQNHRDECDVNMILAKFQKTGAMTHVNDNQPQYVEHTGMDFKEAMDVVSSSQELFDGLPSDIRTHFRNDPSEFLDYVNDPKNASDVDNGFPSIVGGKREKRPGQSPTTTNDEVSTGGAPEESRASASDAQSPSPAA